MIGKQNGRRPGKHRLRPGQPPTMVRHLPRPCRGRRSAWSSRLFGPKDSPRRIIVSTAATVVVALGAVIGLASTGVSARAEQADPPGAAQIMPAPTIPIPTTTTPKNVDEAHDLLTAPDNMMFLAALNASGISTAGREELLLKMVHQAVAEHTTDADLEQSVRALFPDIDQVRAEKLAYQVRKVWPGPSNIDTDGDGR